ncbi:LPXTG cell wall anchor domain-containing protein [Streptococcus suis]|nr:LPXTG cell wall anchor domain-containing protein [Streptococcus suis]
MSESVSESISESNSESVSESISESVSESISESVSESISESVPESVSESVSESTPSQDSQLPRKSAVLPSTGEESSSWAGLLGAGLLFGALYKRRKKDEEEK